MKWIPKYQKAGSINVQWVRDRDVNGNWGYRNFKTGQFRTAIPNSQEEKQLEQRKNNNAALRQYSADSARYNRERATRKNHSDETIKKVISKPSLIMRNNGKTTVINSGELAPGEDSAKLNTTIEEQIPVFKGMRLVAGLGKLALSKLGQNGLSHWARNSLLNEAAGSLTKTISNDALANAANKVTAKYTTLGDNPIQQMSYYKPTRKAWTTGEASGNSATSYYFKQQPSQRFELVKDLEPNNYSVHFKTDRGSLDYGDKMQLFAKVADEVPEGANVSTWGTISKGGIHGINRFGKDFGFTQAGTRQLKLKGTGEPVDVPIYQHPYSQYSNEKFLANANSFAETYGYPKISYIQGINSTSDLETAVKSMLDRHNTFARGVHTPDIEEQKQIRSIIGENATMNDMLRYVSTHGRLEDPRKRVFISGYSNAQAYSGFPNNGRTALVQRKYKLGSDRNKWFDEADFKIYSYPESDNITTPHIRAPWAQGKSEIPETELSSENGELLFKGWVEPEIRTVKDTEGNRHWWLQEQFPEDKLSKNLKVK